jgi:antitoxin VapB
VRIPKELAIVEVSQEVEIERVGQTLVIRPVTRETLADLPAIFASFSDGMRRWQREPNEQKERDWSGWWGSAPLVSATELRAHDPGLAGLGGAAQSNDRTGWAHLASSSAPGEPAAAESGDPLRAEGPVSEPPADTGKPASSPSLDRMTDRRRGQRRGKV